MHACMHTHTHTHSQFFDDDSDGRVSLSNITQKLPIKALPTSPESNQDNLNPSNMTLGN